MYLYSHLKYIRHHKLIKLKVYNFTRMCLYLDLVQNRHHILLVQPQEYSFINLEHMY